LILVSPRLRISREEAEELRRRTDTRAMLLSDSRAAVKSFWQTANIMRKEGFTAAVRSSIEDLADWAEVERPDLARLTPNGKVAILFSDIEGSTALNERMGDRAWVRRLDRHDRLVQKCVKAHCGHVVKHQGDGYMIAFAQPAQAVRCAVDIQRGLRRGLDGIRIRIGIHSGRSLWWCGGGGGQWRARRAGPRVWSATIVVAARSPSPGRTRGVTPPDPAAVMHHRDPWAPLTPTPRTSPPREPW
jgi:hypothetical protein